MLSFSADRGVAERYMVTRLHKGRGLCPYLLHVDPVGGDAVLDPDDPKPPVPGLVREEVATVDARKQDSAPRVALLSPLVGRAVHIAAARHERLEGRHVGSPQGRIEFPQLDEPLGQDSFDRVPLPGVEVQAVLDPVGIGRGEGLEPPRLAHALRPLQHEHPLCCDTVVTDGRRCCCAEPGAKELPVQFGLVVHRRQQGVQEGLDVVVTVPRA